MELQPGAKLGPYEILSAIGRGGMGEVWKARDTRLNRDAAIKTSRAEFSGRFQKEAQAIAALNHPNICTLHDVEPDYLVMEFIEGVTLAERIEQGPILVEEALRIAKQIGDALEAAHDKNIVHRDLKPANIRIRPDGSVKVLDFGLARAGEAQQVTGDSPTMMTVGTQTGIILGTAGYMSPEQARGQTVDRRADIWAFGVVLWEMLTRKRLFDGETVSDSLAAILTKEPDLTLAPEKTRRLLGRCLEKDPRKRLRGIGDWQELLAEPGRPAPSQSRLPLVWAACVPAALVAALAGAWVLLHPASAPQITRFEIHAPPGATLPLGTPAVSPDGRTIVFAALDKAAERHLYARTLDSEEARLLPGTEGAMHPFFSPDGRSLAFAAGTSRLMRIDVAGGVPRPIAEPGSLGPWHGTWSRDGVILLSGPSSPRQVSANGGPLTDLGLSGIGHPFFLPDGRQWLGLENTGPRLLLFTLGSKQPKLVLDNAESSALLASTPGGPAYLFYLRGNDLLARQFNEQSGKVVNEPVAIANDVGRVARPDLVPALGVSRSGTIAFQRSGSAIDQLTWLDRSGKQLGESSPGFRPRLSPDGRFAAVVRTTLGRRAIWIVDLARRLDAPQL